MAHSVVNALSPANSSPHFSGNSVKERAKWFSESVGMDYTKEIMPIRHNMIDAHRNSPRQWLYAQGLHRSKSDGIPELGDGSGHESHL